MKYKLFTDYIIYLKFSGMPLSQKENYDISLKKNYDTTVRDMMRRYDCEKLYVEDMSYEEAVITIQNNKKIKYPPQISLNKFKEVLNINKVLHLYNEFMYHPSMSVDDAADIISELRDDPYGITGLDELYKLYRD